MVDTKTKKRSKAGVSEKILKEAASRLIAQGTLVSTEIQYLQRVLGTSASQVEIDEQVIAVRKLPWASIAVPE